MARKPPPPPAPKGPQPPRRRQKHDPLASALASTVRKAHGVDQGATFDMSDELGQPRGFVGTRNIAIERALGAPGFPMGRITEISGWAGAGKSTVLDQLLAQCQLEGGIGVLADTERTRNRPYMARLGVRPESLVWIGGTTVELMFSEIETLVRTAAHLNCMAWVDALNREGLRVPKPETYDHIIYGDKVPGKGRKKLEKFTFAKWGRAQAAKLMEYQMANGLKATSIRTAESRESLNPVVVHGDVDAEKKAAFDRWVVDGYDPMVQPADRPIVIGWDSVAGTPTEEELDGDSRDQHPATAAKVIKRNLRRLVQQIADEAIAFVLVNQRYEKIAMGGSRGGSETYGGQGIKYHTTVRISVDKVGDIYTRSADKQNGVPPIGQICRVKVPKNKVNDPYRTEHFGLIFGRGADNAWALFEDLKTRAIIRQGGAWCRFTDPSILGAADRSFRGWQDLSNMMAEDSNLWTRLHRIYMDGR